ncbi:MULTISPECIES: hypothetical protein [unclassified Streptomyces]|uniref:hypothetical protein n=1 Tax=unclassified Streptomyces TaxID=2593676 RepID=UPI003657AE94
MTTQLLAQELDTGPPSQSVYAANTAELHAAVSTTGTRTCARRVADADGPAVPRRPPP